MRIRNAGWFPTQILSLCFSLFRHHVCHVSRRRAENGIRRRILQRALGSLIPVSISQRESGAFTNRTVSFNPTIIGNVEGQIKTSEAESFQKLSEEIQKEVEKLTAGVGKSNPPSDSQIQYFIDKRGLVIRVPEAFFFKSGEAWIRQEFTPILNALGKSLKKSPTTSESRGTPIASRSTITNSPPIGNFPPPGPPALSGTF